MYSEMRMGAQSHLSVAISANGYTVSNYKYYILERVDTLTFSGKNGEFCPLSQNPESIQIPRLCLILEAQ